MPPKYMGAAAVILDGAGRILLVKHSYGNLQWGPPGGLSESGESAAETVVREVWEETGLEVIVSRLTGVYFEPDVDLHHFVFACVRKELNAEPTAVPPEITKCGFFPRSDLPRPISDFTVRRIEDAIDHNRPASVTVIGPRVWLPEDNAVPMTDSTNLTDDRFGYSCYAFVFPVSPEIRTKVTAIEQASRMTRAKIPAHITVKGTFHEIADLDEVRVVARRAIGGTKRFRVSFDGAMVDIGLNWAGLDMKVTPEMQRLHDALVAAFKPMATTVYTDDPYHAHMTLYQEAPANGVEPARALIGKTDLGPGFEAYAIDLLGRRGPAYGGRWELVERFPLE